MPHHNTNTVRNAESKHSAEQLISERTGEEVVNSLKTPDGAVIVVTDPERQYQWTDHSGTAYYKCVCGRTFNEDSFENDRCPECRIR